MDIKVLVAEAINEKYKKMGKVATIAAGVGAIGGDVIRRKMAGDSFSDIGSAYINKGKEIKDKIGKFASNIDSKINKGVDKVATKVDGTITNYTK